MIDVNDPILKDNKDYQDFLNNNKGVGFIKIRASSAKSAVPISNMDIIISKEIGKYNVIFYKGKTDESGMINDITVPACNKKLSDLKEPICSIYKIEAIYKKDNIDTFYDVKVYDGITTIQYINVISNIRGIYD